MVWNKNLKGEKYKKHFKKGITAWNKDLKGKEFLKHYKNGNPIQYAKNPGKYIRTEEWKKEVYGNPERNKKISKANILRWKKPAYRKKVSKKLSQVVKEQFASGERIGFWTGKKRSEETIKKISKTKKLRYKLGLTKPSSTCFKKGMPMEQHPRWLNGKSFEQYGLGFNRTFKNEIRNRDNQICMMCLVHREKLSEALIVHHVNYDKQLNVKENAISLCRCCHAKTNSNRQHWTKFFQSLLSEKYCYHYNDSNIVFDLDKELNNQSQKMKGGSL